MIANSIVYYNSLKEHSNKCDNCVYCYISFGVFKASDTNPGGTLELFTKYVERIKFDLAFRKADGTLYDPCE